MGLAGWMSMDQEAAVMAAIIKVAGTEVMEKFPEVVDAMESWDPCNGYLKFLILVEEICW